MQKLFTSFLFCLLVSIGASAQSSANKTTIGGSRWYNYSYYVDTFYKAGVSGLITDTTQVRMWQDTMARGVYTSGLANVLNVSVGSVFHPQSNSFNNCMFYAGEMEVDSSRAYTIDSVRVFGFYRYNPAKTAVIDTLVLGLMTGTTFIDTAWPSVNFHFPWVSYDSSTGVAATSSTPAPVIYRNILTSANWGDTTADGLFSTVFAITPPITVPATGIAMATLSFRSGDAGFIPFDTIVGQPGTSRYNVFFPGASYVVDNSGAAQFPFYDSTDRNESLLLHRRDSSGHYLSTRLFASGGAAPEYQQLMMSWHVNCTTCTLLDCAGSVTAVNAAAVTVYPSPVSDKLYIDANSVGGIFSITNVLGHNVFTGRLNARKSVIDVAQLPAGIYIYTLTTGSTPVTGRFIIAR